MNKIQYNEEQEAFEITYKLWDKDMTVRFYAEDQQAIMDNLSEIAQKLEAVNGGKRCIAEVISEDGYYEGDAKTLEENLVLRSVYADIDEDGVVICFTADSSDGYLTPVSVELMDDNEFEATGYVD